jgi:hypothetical protein
MIGHSTHMRKSSANPEKPAARSATPLGRAGSRTSAKMAAAVASVKTPSPTMTGRQPNASAALASGEAPITLPAAPKATNQDVSIAKRAVE